MSALIRNCFKCRHYVLVEEKIGYCKLFDNLQNARSNKNLCGPDGKYFSDAIFRPHLSVEKPSSDVIRFPWFFNW